MGELNLDNIDRALLREYKRNHDGGCFNGAVRTVDNAQTSHKVPPYRHGQLPPDNNYASTR